MLVSQLPANFFTISPVSHLPAKNHFKNNKNSIIIDLSGYFSEFTTGANMDATQFI